MAITFDEKLEAAWGLHKIEKQVLEKEIAELRAENEKLRKALNGWQEWWELPWQDKRPDIAELIYCRAAAAIRESGDE